MVLALKEELGRTTQVQGSPAASRKPWKKNLKRPPDGFVSNRAMAGDHSDQGDGDDAGLGSGQDNPNETSRRGKRPRSHTPVRNPGAASAKRPRGTAG
jgi:hypothetical protein